MTPTTRNFALQIGALLAAATAASPASAAPSFGACDARMWLSQGPDGNTPTTLYDIDTVTNPFTFKAVGQGASVYNATGYNPIDNYLYAIDSKTSHLLRVGADGSTITLGAVTGMPPLDYNAGDIGGDGTYYVTRSNQNTLYAIDITTRTAQAIPLKDAGGAAATFAGADVAWVNGLLYTVGLTDGQLTSIDPKAGTMTNIGKPSGKIGFGALVGTPNGLFGNDNGGTGFYQIDLKTGARTNISGAPSASVNDGAHCVNANMAFGADLAITMSDNGPQYVRGGTVGYTIVARNNGPFGAQGVTVSDPLPAGVAAAAWTCKGQGGGVCAASGTGAIIDKVDLPVGATVTYTLALTVPANYTGNLVNKATMTPGPATKEINPANTAATDTDLPLVGPGANDDGVSTNFESPVTFDPAANDNSDPGTVLDPTSIDLDPSKPGDRKSVTVPGQATFKVDPLSNRVQFTPEPGFVGVVTAPYTIKDALDQVSNPANLTVTVRDPASSAKPVANDDDAVTKPVTPVSVDPTGNDVPGKGTDLDPSTVKLIDPADGKPKTTVSGPEGKSTVDPATGVVDFTPAPGFNGVGAINYTVQDKSGKVSEPAEIRVTVKGGNTLLAVDDSGSTQPKTPVTLSILANDTPADGENLLGGSIDLDPSTPGREASITDEAGTWSVDASGYLAFTPAADYRGTGHPFTGTASLPYTVGDSAGNVSNGKVQVTVNPDAVTAKDDGATTASTTAVTPAPALNDLAAPGATLNPSTVDLDPSTPGVIDRGPITTAEGTWEVVDTAGTVRFTPRPGFDGNATLKYAIHDSLGNVATATMTVTVAVAPPAAVIDHIATPLNTPANCSVGANDSFPPDATFSLNRPPAHGRVVFNPDGSCSYVPDKNFSGTDNFSYQVCLPSPNQSVCSSASADVAVAGGRALQKNLVLKASDRSACCGRPVVVRALGGDGKGAVRYSVKASGPVSCRLAKYGKRRLLRIYGPKNSGGFCTVTATKQGDAAYEPVTSKSIVIRLR